MAVVYLVRAADGAGAAERFLRSYSKRDAGLDHDLVLVAKGLYTSVQTLALDDLVTENRVECVRHRVVDGGFDLGSYWQVLRSFEYDHFCFLNAFSEILSDAWLAHLLEPVLSGAAGVSGATGSYESPYSAAVREAADAAVQRDFLQAARRALRAMRLSASFPLFPNPHLRTNAFVVPREIGLQINVGSTSSKLDALRLESGRNGFTRQVHAAGLNVVVVGRDGQSYPTSEWAASATFRSGNQTNLLVADNRTRQFEAASEDERLFLSRSAWG